MSKYRTINRFKKPDGTETAHAQSLNTEPYKPVYATEAYEADVAEAIAHYNDSDTWEFRNPNVAQRAVSTKEKLDTDVPIDKDHAYGENKWFIGQCRESSPAPTSTAYLKFTFDPTLSNDIALTGSGANIEESVNGETWGTYTLGTVISLSSGQTEWYFRAKSGSTPIYGFKTTAIKVEGQLTSLVDYDNKDTVQLSADQFSTVGYQGGSTNFQGLFTGPNDTVSCPNLKDLSDLILPPDAQVPDTAHHCLACLCADLTALTKDGLPALYASGVADGQYDGMFYGCTGLTELPNGYLDDTFCSTPGTAVYSWMFAKSGLTSIPAGLLDTPYLGGCIWEDELWGYQSAYTEMFAECTGLTDVSNLNLPATNLTPCCYGHMFRACTNLIKGPVLPATTLKSGCYKGMFMGCTSLTRSPELPANNLPDHDWSTSEGYKGYTRGCYESMFDGCTAIATAPALPATVIGTGCYRAMFNGCSGLITPPNVSDSYPCGVLPAEYTKISCYDTMFAGCTALEYGPDLPSEDIASYAYRYMFDGCSSLKRIHCAASSWDSDSTYGWVASVASEGTFFGDSELVPYYGSASTLWSVGSSHNDGVPSGLWWYNPVKFTGSSFTTIKLTNGNVMSYSEDGINWNAYTLGDSITVGASKTIYFRGNPSSGTFNSIYGFEGDFEKVEGNALALTSVANTGGSVVTVDNWFCNGGTSDRVGLFGNSSSTVCPNLRDASSFSLVYGSNSTISALTKNCYMSMFERCTSLASAPKLPAETLDEGSYAYMFQRCTSLTTPSVMSANSFVSGSKSSCTCMFNNCTALVASPQINFTVLNEESCFGMFYNCTSLTLITCLVTDHSALNCTSSWVGNVASGGMFRGPADMNPDTGGTNKWSRGDSGVQSGWTYEDIS